MSQAPSATSNNSTGGRVHSLIIGIDRYKHFRGGGGPRARFSAGMEQLTSAVKSARAFDKWVRTELFCPEAPQEGMRRVLLSDVHERIPEDQRATHRNIVESLESWRNACDEHEDNLGILYFCGHGYEIGLGGIWLLPEDYGQDHENPLVEAIELDSVADAMRGTRAKLLCFLLDCCRRCEDENSIKNFIHPKNRGRRDDQRPWRMGPTAGGFTAPILSIPAAPPRGIAQAEHGRESYFTRALLKSFRGMGATNDEAGRWTVTTETLVLGIGEALDGVFTSAKKRVPKPRPDSANFTLSNLTLHGFSPAKPPVVPVEVGCNPPDATAHAALHLLHAGGQAFRCPSQPEPWIIEEAEVGSYDLHLTFQAGGAYTTSGQPRRIEINPPRHRLVVDVQ